jgi:hypothetical protein
MSGLHTKNQLIKMPHWLNAAHPLTMCRKVGNDVLQQALLYAAGHSGLTCSRFDDTLPLLYSHALYPGFAGNGHGADHHNWANAFHERADQATATSPLRPPLRSTSAGDVLVHCLQLVIASPTVCLRIACHFLFVSFPVVSYLSLVCGQM